MKKHVNKSSASLRKNKVDNESNATSALLIGTIALICLFSFTKYAIFIAITGIIFAILSRSKKRKAIAITLNSLVIFFSIFLLATNNAFYILDRSTIEGEWDCKTYNGLTEGKDYVISLNLKGKNNFSWYKYNDYINNRITGTFIYTKVLTNTKIKTYNMELNGTEQYINGENKENIYTAKYKLEINNKHLIMTNIETDNMYSCYKKD